MQIDFRERDTWSKINEHVASSLNINTEKTAVQVYQGVGHALVETAIGLTKLYSLKKKIYYFKNMNPIFDSALMSLAKDGYQLTALDLSVLAAPDAWAATLTREDLFVLYSVDEPLTGRAYDVTALEKCLTDKSLIQIRVSHLRHKYENIFTDESFLANKNRIAISSIRHDLAVGTFGDRARIGAVIADQLLYDHLYKSKINSDVNLDVSNAAKIIRDFENRNVAGSTPLFSLEDLRIYDRAAIYWHDIDGEAMITRLAQKLDIDLMPPGQETRLETTSLTRWGGVKTFDFYKSLGLSQETLRGLVFIGHELLTKNASGDLEKKLIEVRQSILEDQLGG